jgi:hypothetical protein
MRGWLASAESLTRFAEVERWKQGVPKYFIFCSH